MHPSYPYPEDPHPAFWGPVTATTDFCEENYIITPYIAEFVNTLTNVVYMLYAIRGLRKLHAHHHLDVFSALPFVGLAAVGFFSGLFHVTLHEWAQLSDDLSMVIPTTLILCRLLTFELEDRTAARRINAGIVSVLLVIYSLHIYLNLPIFATIHGLLFMSMVSVIAFLTRRALPARVKDLAIRRKLIRAAQFGGGSFLFGFFLWNVDQRACGSLTATKRAIGMPWSFVLELHGWWHILTGIGAYVFITLVDYLASDRAGEDPGYMFGWPTELVYGAGNFKHANGVNGMMNGKANGHVNGKVNGNVNGNVNGKLKQ